MSMGHIFRVPCVRVHNLARTISNLQEAPYRVRAYASVVDPDLSSPKTCILGTMRSLPSASWCLVMGNEGNGISTVVREVCRHTISIAMSDGVDSLSVPVACGILLINIF